MVSEMFKKQQQQIQWQISDIAGVVTVFFTSFTFVEV